MSYSRYLHTRFQAHARRRLIVAAIYIASSLVYLGWRLTILNPQAMTLSLVYYGAEILGFVLGLTLIFSSWTFRHREPKPAPSGLRVDVFVTAYKEPEDIIRRTLRAARDISYPHRTLLLDDASRTELRALAAELGVQYAARGTNENAKAGNLRFGFSLSDADFVMTFDADHIALPQALDVTLGFFGDARVALVQTPQDYYNIDAFQYFNARRGGGLWHDQSFFYAIAQPCRDAFNGASCVGTGVVYRRSAIDGIGGIPTTTVTEDLHTSLKLHKAGYEVVFLSEPVAHGIAASDLRDYYRTRHRWAHGNLHVLREENILFCKGLTLGQRLSYLTLGLIYLEGWQQLALFCVPIVSLFMGWAPFTITIANVLAVLIFPLFTALLLQELGCGLSRYWVNEIFSVARFPIHIVSLLGLFKRPMPFRSSFKNVKGRIDISLLTPQMLVAMVSLGALAFGLANMDWNLTSGPFVSAFRMVVAGNGQFIEWDKPLVQGYTIELVAVAGFWALFNAAKSAYLIRKAVIDARRSQNDYRFDATLAMTLEDWGAPVPDGDVDPARLARIESISLSFARIRFYPPQVVTAGETLRGRIVLPAGPLDVVCVVKKVIRAGPGQPVVCEVDWSWADEAARTQLELALYSVEWHREFRHRNAFFLTPLDVLSRLMGMGRVSRDRKRQIESPGRDHLDWAPALHVSPGHIELAFIGSRPRDSRHSVLSFADWPVGQSATFIRLNEDAAAKSCLSMETAEPLSTLADIGLDRSRVRRYRAHAVEK